MEHIVYDQDGTRISRTQSGTTRNYFYDNGVVAYTEDGSSVSSANILAEDGAAVGTYRGSAYYNYLKDMQGSTTNIVKEDGTLSAAYDYTDFGETTELTGSGFDNQVCYTSGIYDEETALYYLNARYYDPETGRFISQDSYRGELNDPGQWHLYTYCANNPINYVDPSGHAIVTWSKKFKGIVKAYWEKPISEWAKVKECRNITVSKKRTVTATISTNFGITKKEIVANIGLDASVQNSWSTTITLEVNKNSSKKYVRAILKANANKWKVTRTKKYFTPTGYYRVETKVGTLHLYRKGSMSCELQYSNTKKK